MRRPAPNLDTNQDVTDRGRVLRDPLPTARAILWKPLPDSYHLLASMMRTSEQQAFLFVTQRAFLQVERHLRSAPDLEIGGFLAGQLFECPRTHVRYSVINTVVPFADVSADALEARVTPESFETVRKRLDRHQLSLIGWYRSGAGLGLQLLPDDVETHLKYFNQPWQTTVLIVPDPGKPKGAFFTYDPRVSRGYCIPFYELFDSPAADANRLGRTCVSWTTYVAAAPVSPLPVAEKENVEATVAPLRKPEPEPEPVEPIDEWWDAIKDPWVRLKDVAAGHTRRDGPMPLVYESAARKPNTIPISLEPPRHPPAPVEQERVPDDITEMPRPSLGAQHKEAPRAQPISAAAPPFAGPARPVAPAPVRSPAPAPRAVERRPLAESEVPPAAGAPRPQPRRTPAAPRPIQPAAAEAMLRVSTAPAVGLLPDFHAEALRWQRRRRIGFAVAGATFLAAIVLNTVRSRSDTGAQAATYAGISDVAAAQIPPASETGPPVISLPSAVDSLSKAMAYYREIANDHRKGLVGCRVLDRAYALVGRARTRMDSSRAQIAGALADSDSIRVSLLGAEYTFVTQTYRRSGCPSA